MINTKRIISISRPRFWIYECGTFVIGALAAVRDPRDILTLPFFLFAFYFLFPANLFIYGVNDIFDYETDRLNPKKTIVRRHAYSGRSPKNVATYFSLECTVCYRALFL